MKLEACSSIERRIDATRVSAEDLVNQLIAETDFADQRRDDDVDDDDDDTAECKLSQAVAYT